MKKDQSMLRRMAIQSFKRRKATKRQLYFSIISLFIALAIFITGTFSWFSSQTAKLNAREYTLQCGKGLRVNDSGTSDYSFTDAEKNIIPASSINGRNLFFPTDGTDFSKKTEEMTFRSANVGDKNKNYIQIDFTLTAQENNTALYIDDDEAATYLKVLESGTERKSFTAPMRIAIWAGSQVAGEVPNEPVVFNPTGKTFNTPAVQSVDKSTGAVLKTERQTSHAFSDYAYGGEPVATLSKGVETKLSIIIWLEGADKRSENLQGKTTDIQFRIKFTTSWDKTQLIRFRDSTTGNWVRTKLNDGYHLYLHYDESESANPTHDVTDFLMYQYNSSDTEWMCHMPGDMHNKVSFELRPSDPNDPNTPTYKFTKSSKTSGAETYDREFNRLYVAEGAIASHVDECTGYWVDLGDSDGGGSDIHDLDGEDF